MFIKEQSLSHKYLFSFIQICSTYLQDNTRKTNSKAKYKNLIKNYQGNSLLNSHASISAARTVFHVSSNVMCQCVMAASFYKTFLPVKRFFPFVVATSLSCLLYYCRVFIRKLEGIAVVVLYK